MFSSFKNIELFRYFVRVDLNKGIEKIIKKNDDNFSLIAGSIFSGSFSILGTYFGLHEVQYSNICKIFLATTLFALLFVIGMYLFKSFRWFIKYVKNCGKREKLPSKAEIKEYIDEFDHIACDNILICQNFIRAYSNKKTSNDLKEFYFYEIIYYAKVSVAIIHKIIANKQVCINDKNNINRVHLFRLENAISMLWKIHSFLDCNQKDIKLDSSMKNALLQEITDLGGKLEGFVEDCNKIKQQNF